MDQTVFTEEHTLPDGSVLTITIAYDEYHDMWDYLREKEDVFAVTKPNRYFDLRGPCMKWKDVEVYAENIKAYENGDLDPEDEEEAWVIEEIEKITKEYEIFPLYAYVHSGASFRLGGFSCPWDSGQCGFVLVRKDAGWVVEEGEKPEQAYLKAAESFVKDLDNVAQGYVYRYSVEDEDGDIIDSCCGFVGDYDNEDCGPLTEARDAVKRRAAEAQKEVDKIDALIRDIDERNRLQDLDRIVGEIKANEAKAINQLGVNGQVKFLLDDGWDIAGIKQHLGLEE